MALEAEGFRHALSVRGNARLVVAILSTAGVIGAAEIGSDHGVPASEQRHHLSPFPSGLRKAVQENERWPFADGHCMNVGVTDTHHAMPKSVRIRVHHVSFHVFLYGLATGHATGAEVGLARKSLIAAASSAGRSSAG
jgi:hypothetical protein